MDLLDSVLQKAWASTCRVVLRRELGSLDLFRPWLLEHIPKVACRDSVYGKVILARDCYPEGASCVPQDRVTINKEFTLSINQIKDIDSIISACLERFEYVGNKVLGNSAFVRDSDIVIDSQYVNSSTNIEESSYIDCSFMVRKGSKYCFGSGYCGQSEFLIRTIGTFNSKYCFESYFVTDSSSAYFCESCHGCKEIMFCFGQRNSLYKIGNLQLPKDKYFSLKSKLLEEVCDELEKEGRFPALFEIAKESSERMEKLEIESKTIKQNMKIIDNGFEKTSRIILKRGLGPIKEYENWLMNNSQNIAKIKSAFGMEVSIPLSFAYFSFLPKDRIVSFDEMEKIGQQSLSQQDIASIKQLKQKIGKIAYFTSEFYAGENANYIDSPVVFYATNVYKTYDATYADNIGASFLALNSKFIYGGFRILESQFSIKCYNSLYMNRCMEMDSCSKCSDSYFCHNCESLADCMFCFSAKGKRNMIGNMQLSKERYAKIKDSLVQQMADELEKTKRLRFSIYFERGKD
ncbi:MAG: hypothetical protein QXN37_02055 [Candidatus Anstonellaceae archaeon]